eukprot:3425785-Pyramimonas_sp.AAC.1
MFCHAPACAAIICRARPAPVFCRPLVCSAVLLCVLSCSCAFSVMSCTCAFCPAPACYAVHLCIRWVLPCSSCFCVFCRAPVCYASGLFRRAPVRSSASAVFLCVLMLLCVLPRVREFCRASARWPAVVLHIV